jgi:hypothetical protein
MIKRRRLSWAAGAVSFLSLMALTTTTAQAAQPCDESIARYRLAQLQEALQRPESMARMDAAKMDFLQDQDFDNKQNAKYLAAASVYFKAEDHLNAGAVAEACQFLQQANGLINEILAGP